MSCPIIALNLRRVNNARRQKLESHVEHLEEMYILAAAQGFNRQAHKWKREALALRGRIVEESVRDYLAAGLLS